MKTKLTSITLGVLLLAGSTMAMAERHGNNGGFRGHDRGSEARAHVIHGDRAFGRVHENRHDWRWDRRAHDGRYDWSRRPHYEPHPRWHKDWHRYRHYGWHEGYYRPAPYAWYGDDGVTIIFRGTLH